MSPFQPYAVPIVVIRLIFENTLVNIALSLAVWDSLGFLISAVQHKQQ